jgi:argininosuccinate synthase
MNAIFATTIYYGLTFSRAEKELDNYLKSIDVDVTDVISLYRGDNIYQVRLKDGSSYIAMKASEYCKGYRFINAYVDKSIDKQIFEDWILPYKFYNEGSIMFF